MYYFITGNKPSKKMDNTTDTNEKLQKKLSFIAFILLATL